MSQTPNSQPEPPPQQGISLDELTAAFAEVMGTEPSAKAEVEKEPTSPAEPEMEQGTAEQRAVELVEPEREPQPAEKDDPCEICPRSILEAMLFVGNRDSRPLSAVKAAEVMRDVEPEDIPGLVAELNRRYAANGCPYHVLGDGCGYRLTLRKAFQPLRNRFYGRIREARLSQAAIDVLAAVAYQQPLTAEQISHVRGKPSSHLLSQLVRRGLLRIERRDPKRRTASYFTTDRFLELFGLASLDDLPQSGDLDRR